MCLCVCVFLCVRCVDNDKLKIREIKKLSCKLHSKIYMYVVVVVACILCSCLFNLHCLKTNQLNNYHHSYAATNYKKYSLQAYVQPKFEVFQF